MARYASISDHGLIGDLQTAALVTTDGTVDWFCCPRFDSPSVFASLVDADKGGHFRIAPDRDDFVSRQLYLLLPPSLFEHPAAELSVDDSAQLGEDRGQPDHIA
jgi:GH15 family glucan-1,4-alpha-glucosidase